MSLLVARCHCSLVMDLSMDVMLMAFPCPGLSVPSSHGLLYFSISGSWSCFSHGETEV